jgi:pimeloyl-ACP methyl ester carboxylesterase
MPLYERGDVRIRYEETGSGFPLLVTPGGGLNSRVSNWPNAVFNAMEVFKNDFRCITMDQRNANGGESTGPVSVDNPWDAFADDQLGLMDHLGIREFFYMGYCTALKTAVDQLLTREFKPPPGVTKSGKPEPVSS